MLFQPEPKIWLCTEPTDMRKSFDGLCAAARNKLNEDPLSGQLFVFINKRKTHIKILYFDQDGFCIWSKRLEQGQYNYPRSNDKKQLLDITQLQWIIKGLKVEKYR